jgi:hypothetical protein
MAVTVIESARSREPKRSVEGATIPLRWVAWGSIDHEEVYAAIALNSPDVFDTYQLREISCVPQGGGVWLCESLYGFGPELLTDTPTTPLTPVLDSPLGPDYTFDLTAKTAHITQSIATVESVASGGGAAPNFQKAIGVDRDRVNGTEAFYGYLEFTRFVEISPLTLRILQSWKNLVGRTNSVAWGGFGAQECLYLGCVPKCMTGAVWQIWHKFAAGETWNTGDPRLIVSPSITMSQKKPFDYLWAAYQYGNDAVASRIVQTPAAAYIEQVQFTGDFTILGLGS